MEHFLQRVLVGKLLGGRWVNQHINEIQSYTSLVKRIAQNLLGRLPAIVQLEDLMQSGMIGLLEALKNYNINKGASFETYAAIRIRGAMLDEIRKGDWAPRSVHRNTRRIRAAIRMIEHQTGRDAKDIEVARSLGIPLHEYHQMLQDTHGTRVFGFNEIGLNDEVISEKFLGSIPGPLDGLEREDFRDNLAKCIKTLPEREHLVLTLYYEQGHNLRKVGEMLGVSESRISQIHHQAMQRLQTRLKEWDVQDELR